MTMKISYLIDLAAQKFTVTDGKAESWIQAMPLGEYSHPVYGKIDITPERVNKFADNVNNKVRQTDLDIDYDHKEFGGEAAGWVTKAEARLNESDPRQNGLWVFVEWTAKAWEAIKSKAYRYFSPEFDDEWTDPKSGETFKDVLFGGGITNRPFLKDILPLNLSEKFTATEGKLTMTDEQFKELLKLVGLDDTATFDDLIAKLKGAGDDPNNPPKQNDEPAAPGNEGGDQPKTQKVGDLLVQLSEADVKKLSENPVTAKLLSVLETQGQAIEDQAVALKEMKVVESVAKLSEKATTKQLAFTPNTKTALSEIFRTADTNTTSLVTKIVDNFINGSAVVKLSDPTVNDPNKNDNVKKFSDRVSELMTEKKLSYRDAALIAAAEDSDSYDNHRMGE